MPPNNPAIGLTILLETSLKKLPNPDPNPALAVVFISGLILRFLPEPPNASKFAMYFVLCCNSFCCAALCTFALFSAVSAFKPPAAPAAAPTGPPVAYPMAAGIATLTILSNNPIYPPTLVILPFVA